VSVGGVHEQSCVFTAFSEKVASAQGTSITQKDVGDEEAEAVARNAEEMGFNSGVCINSNSPHAHISCFV
jgi:electron transfer flavoprotein alpha/beta subunit